MLGKIEGRRRKGDRGQVGWIASPTPWTWVWANSRRQWRTEKPGVLQCMGSQRVWYNLATKQQEVTHTEGFRVALENRASYLFSSFIVSVEGWTPGVTYPFIFADVLPCNLLFITVVLNNCLTKSWTFNNFLMRQYRLVPWYHEIWSLKA